MTWEEITLFPEPESAIDDNQRAAPTLKPRWLLEPTLVATRKSSKYAQQAGIADCDLTSDTSFSSKVAGSGADSKMANSVAASDAASSSGLLPRYSGERSLK